MVKTYIFGLFLLFIAGCSDNTSTERTDGFSDVPTTREDSLFKDVMDGHDVGMAKMGKLARYRKDITHKLDSLGKLSSSEVRDSLKAALEKLGGQLKEAETGMNTWMDEFSLDSAQDDLEQRLPYLKAEKQKINKVRDQILEALDKADSLLKKN